MNTSSRPPRTTGPSAGIEDLASADASGAETGRLAELEDRLARLEQRVTLRDRGRSMIDRIVPPEAGRHFREAGRHQLLGFRSIIDFWIDRIDRRDTAASDQPERIDVQ